MKVVLAGGTGFIGRYLKQYFLQKGYKVWVLTRSIGDDDDVYWDGKALGEWTQILEEADALINLSGKNIFCRWNKHNKSEIFASRLESTTVLSKAIQRCSVPPKVWINASGIGYYTSSFDEQDECSSKGNGEVSRLSDLWESALFLDDLKNTKRVALRIGFVLGKEGGGYPFLKRMTQYFLGGALADGGQWMSWIHIQDLARQIEWLILNKKEGAYNGVSPYPIKNRDFMYILRHVCKRPWSPSVPRWFLKIVLFYIGLPLDLVLLSHRILPKRFLSEGFRFEHKSLEEAFQSIV